MGTVHVTSAALLFYVATSNCYRNSIQGACCCINVVRCDVRICIRWNATFNNETATQINMTGFIDVWDGAEFTNPVTNHQHIIVTESLQPGPTMIDYNITNGNNIATDSMTVTGYQTAGPIACVEGYRDKDNSFFAPIGNEANQFCAMDTENVWYRWYRNVTIKVGKNSTYNTSQQFKCLKNIAIPICLGEPTSPEPTAVPTKPLDDNLTAICDTCRNHLCPSQQNGLRCTAGGEPIPLFILQILISTQSVTAIAILALGGYIWYLKKQAKEIIGNNIPDNLRIQSTSKVTEDFGSNKASTDSIPSDLHPKNYESIPTKEDNKIEREITDGDVIELERIEEDKDKHDFVE